MSYGEMKMLSKVAAALLILVIAGSVMAGPVNLPKSNINQTDEEIDLGVKRMVPPPAVKTDEILQPSGLTKPIPASPTPVYDFLWFLLRGSKWAD